MSSVLLNMDDHHIAIGFHNKRVFHNCITMEEHFWLEIEKDLFKIPDFIKDAIK